MTSEELRNQIPENELIFIASRSSGPGGQNVNKVNTKIEIRFNINLSTVFSDYEKELISKKLKNRINSDGELVVRSQSERTQLNNRKKALTKLLILLSESLTEKPPRKPTAPSRKSREERLTDKKKRGEIKKIRSDGIYPGDNL